MMVDSIILWLKDSLACALNIFDKFITSDNNVLIIFISFFVIYSVYRFLLAPLLGGGAGSDKVKKKANNKSSGGSKTDG